MKKYIDGVYNEHNISNIYGRAVGLDCRMFRRNAPIANQGHLTGKPSSGDGSVVIGVSGNANHSEE